MFKAITPLFEDAKANHDGFINYLLLNSRGEFGYTFSRITSDPEVIELTSVYHKEGGAFDVVVNYITAETKIDADGFFECIHSERVTQLMPFIKNHTDPAVMELYEEDAIVANMVRLHIRDKVVAHSKLLNNQGKAKVMCVFAHQYVTTQGQADMQTFATRVFDIYRADLIVGEYSVELLDAIEDELQAISA